MSMLEETELNWNPQAALNTATEDALSPKAIEWFKTTIADKMKRPGTTYQVELAPSEDEYLDWDKPLSEQSEFVRNVLSGVSFEYPINDGTKGEDVYLHTSLDSSRGIENTGYKAASDYLNSIGIRGIRYLDGNSRGNGAYQVTLSIKGKEYSSTKFQTKDQAEEYASEKRDEGFSAVVDIEGDRIPADTEPENWLEEIGAYAIEIYNRGEQLPGSIRKWVEDFLSAIRSAIISSKHMPERAKLMAMKALKPQDLSRLAIAGLKAKANGIQAQGRQAMAYSKQYDLENSEDSISIEGIESLSSEDAINEAERVFLSSFPESTRTYSRKSPTARSAKASSDRARWEFGADARRTRGIASVLGPFSGYITHEVKSKGLDGKENILVQVYGNEQVDAGLDYAPALSMTIDENGEFSIYGPPSGSKLYKDFSKRGWAEPTRDANGNPHETVDGGFWTKLTGATRQQSIDLLGDAHARALDWLGVEHLGIHRKRTTGATGNTTGREGALYFSRAKPEQSGFIYGSEAREKVAVINRSLLGKAKVVVVGRNDPLPQEIESAAADAGVTRAGFGGVIYKNTAYIVEESIKSLEHLELDSFICQPLSRVTGCAPLGTLQPADASFDAATATQPTTGRRVIIRDSSLTKTGGSAVPRTTSNEGVVHTSETPGSQPP